VTVIDPPGRWASLDWREIWAYRDLLYYFIWRDAKVQYKQTLLGPLWAVLRPILNMLVFSLLFGKLAGIPSEGAAYPLFVYAGLLPWTLFSSAVTQGGQSLITNAHLLRKIYFPRVYLPIAGAGGNLLNFVLGMAVYVVLMFMYAHRPGSSLLLLPVLVLLTLVASLGVSFIFAGLAVFYRDVRFVMTSALHLSMYLTPIIYPVSFIPERYRWLLLLNPMTGLIEGFRSALLNQPVRWEALGVSTVLSLLLLATGLFVFRRSERFLADVV
jgi:lipopolysaccharide transport system permease protein